jgi:basic membrane protein A and related proteins
MRKLLGLTLALSLMGSVALAQDYILGIVFDAGGKFDRSFNEGTWNGFSQAVDELLAEYDIDVLEFELAVGGAVAEGHRQIAAAGAELIVAPGFNQQSAVETVSTEFPDTSFVLIDAAPEEPELYPNARFVLFREHEGSFMVGYIAGTMTQTGVLGFVGGMDVPLIRNFQAGYEQGVAAACPECRVVANYVGTTPAAWNDPARARELATLQQAQGADIMYAAAGASGAGVIDFVNETMCFNPANLPRDASLRETPLTAVVAEIPKSAAYEGRCGADHQPLFFIGVDSNQNWLGDTDGDPSTLNHGLTSMLKRVDVAAYGAVYDVVEGTFEGGVVESLGLEEGGVGYALDEYNEALLPEELLAELEEVQSSIIAGELEVESYQ